MKTLPLSLRLRPEMKLRLQRLAAIDRRTLTGYVEMVLLQHLEAAEGHDGKVARETQPQEAAQEVSERYSYEPEPNTVTIAPRGRGVRG